MNFAVLLPRTNEKMAKEILKRVRVMLETYNQETESGLGEETRPMEINISLGVATSQDGQPLEEVLDWPTKRCMPKKPAAAVGEPARYRNTKSRPLAESLPSRCDSSSIIG
jgi:hypothetical protein